MSFKTEKFLKSISTITEEKAFETLSSLSEKEIEELCESADSLSSENKQKLLDLLALISDENAETDIKEDDIATDAGQTIKSKTGMMASAVGAMSLMPPNDLSHFLDQALAASQQYSSQIPDDAAAKNAASIAMKGVMKEDLDTHLFTDKDLSEEFKFKVSTLFESAVNARVSLVEAEYAEAYDIAVMENLEYVTEEITEKTDKYLSYVAQEWLTENELQVESGLKEEITSDFMRGLKTLFEEHYIDIPESENNAVELLANKVTELEASLNESIKDNIELNYLLSESAKADILEELTAGLSVVEASSLRSLTESVDFNGNKDEFVSKIKVLKEATSTKKYSASNILTEEFEDEPEAKPMTDRMKAYTDSLSRTKNR